MGDAIQFFWAMVDSAKAAMIGLNIVPLLVFSVIIGVVQGRVGFSWFKALLAVGPAIIVASVWPVVYSSAPIWPDFNQLEVEIQTLVQFAVAVVVIWTLGLFKSLLTPLSLSRTHKIIPVTSET